MIKRTLLAATFFSALSGAAMAQSGTIPADAPGPEFPAVSLPVLAGVTPNTSTWPRLIMTTARADAYLTSTNADTIYILQRVASDSATYIANENATPGMYTAAYTGTDDTVYYPPTNAPQIGFTLQDMPVLSELALYVFLHDRAVATGVTYPNISAKQAPPPVEQARSLANTIALNWANNSFKKADGSYITSYSDFTTSATDAYEPQSTYSSIQMHIGRGLYKFANAVDMLLGASGNTMTSAQNYQLITFMERMLPMMVGAVNFHHTPSPATGVQDDDEAHYENQTNCGLLAVVSLAAELGRTSTIQSVVGASTAVGIDPTIPQSIAGTIYGTNDTVRSSPTGQFGAYPNPVTSSSLWQTATPAAGEAVDRYRIYGTDGLGYSDSDIISFEEMAVILQGQGYNLPSFVANKGQSLGTALDYQSKLVLAYLDWPEVFLPATNASIPDFAQYATEEYTNSFVGASVAGKDGVMGAFLLAPQLYPSDSSIAAVIKLDKTLAAQVVTTGSTPHGSTNGGVIVQDAELWSAYNPK